MKLLAAIPLLLAAPAAACGVAGSHSGSGAALKLVDRQPLIVRGSGFRPHEHLHLRLLAGNSSSTSARSDARGAFVVTFPVGLSRCDRIRVIAIRAGGGRVVLKRLPPPACVTQ